MTTTTSSAAPVSAATFEVLAEETRRRLADYEEHPERDDVFRAVQTARRAAAEAIARLPVGQKGGPQVDVVFALLHALGESTFADLPALEDDLSLAEQFGRANWPGLLAAMLLVPSWQWPGAPALDDVQPWLWGEYTAWLFREPKAFTAPGQTTLYAAHCLRRFDELAMWGARNRGSAAVKQALDRCLQAWTGRMLELCPGDLRPHAEARGRFLRAAAGIPGSQSEIPPLSRFGRRLRVGILTTSLRQDAASASLLPLFEQFDPESFETVVFVEHVSGSLVEETCRSQVWEFKVLPEGSDAQADAIRNAAIDVLVFGIDLTAGFSPVVRLALQRLAPLQVATSASCHTSGLPEIDLYVAGGLVEPKPVHTQFSERLGLVRGLSKIFNFERDSQEASMEWTRAMLGLPEDSTVFVSVADSRSILPEVQALWARILAAVPGSRLLLHPFHDEKSAAELAKQFCARFDRSLAAAGVSDNRLVVVTEPFALRADVKAILRVADVCLDTFPTTGGSGLVAPLEVGIPIVTVQGETERARRGPSFLRALNLPELVASDTAGYETIATRVGLDPALRRALADRVRRGMGNVPVFLDPLAASDAFGDLIEKAFDEITELGHVAFRKNPLPLIVDVPAGAHGDELLLNPVENARRALRANPCDWQARHAMGKALLEAGRAGRAAAYLLAALSTGQDSPALWFDLALALRADGKRNQAIEALETSLRLDPTQGEAWLVLIDFAESSGSVDIARDLLEALKANVPDHPQIPMIAARLGC